jgi:excinuclease ABC subunit A
VLCEICKGKRYNAETLEVRYKGATIADVLEMSVEEALAFFEHVPRIERKLRTLDSVGLGYIRLGQQSTTLSGGEAQRVKLAKELSRPGTGQTLYILDEPTTGLHFEDIRHLLSVLRALVKKGNTVVVIEHNMDVVKVADWVVDLGPEGGEAGGRIVGEGTPEHLADQDTFTGAYLKEELMRLLREEGNQQDEDEGEVDLDVLASDEDDVDEEDLVEEEEGEPVE